MSTTLAEVGKAVMVRVEDSGLGLDREPADEAFEPRYTTKRNGIGPGLSIARSIIADHEGRIWAEPGKGGRLVFTLSLA